MNTPTKNILNIKLITAEETYAVRHPVLREGKPLDSCAFDGDHLETTFHIGYFDDGNLIGVASFLKNDHAVHNFTNAGQLRGMAVMQGNQGRGIGKALVSFGETLLREKYLDYVWMNAREIAVPFYDSCGYKKIGPVFDIAKVGNHYVMYKELK